MTAPGVAVATLPGLVTPQDFCVFCLGTLDDSRVFGCQPALCYFALLLIGLLQRALRRVRLALEVFARGADRHIDTAALGDKFTHGVGCPQGDAQLQLIEHLVGQPGAN
ncbi:hypothetical protein D3C85_878830 [compost metagenome]